MLKEHRFNCSNNTLYSIIIDETMKLYGKDPSLAKEGLTHKRELKNTLGQSTNVTQTIMELVENKRIVIETRSKHDTYTTTYNFSEEENTLLSYEEKYLSTKTLRNFNHIIMGFIYKKRINKKTDHIFMALESIIESM